MRFPIAVAATSVAVAALAGCGSAASTATATSAVPPAASTSAAPPAASTAAAAANAVAILAETGATPSPGNGSYAVSADGTFPGGESISVYTYATPDEYKAELANLATLYPSSFNTYIKLPDKQAVVVVNGGGTDAAGNTSWGGPTPAVIADRVHGTVAGGPP